MVHGIYQNSQWEYHSSLILVHSLESCCLFKNREEENNIFLMKFTSTNIYPLFFLAISSNI